MSITIIGLAGRKRCGKDTAARALTDLGWHRLAFGDQLRNAIEALDPYLVPDDGSEAVLLSELLGMGYTWESLKDSPFRDEARRLLERGGTEMGRNTIATDIWITALNRRIHQLADVDADARIVISDVWFHDEAALVRRWRGLVIQITRPAAETLTPAHASDVIDFPVDQTIANDSGVAELHEQIRLLAGPDAKAVA